jgi:GNAT superfamily N-acetyltransferase
MKEYSISTDKGKLQTDVIHGFLLQSYWAQNIPESVIKKSIQNSICFGVYCGDEQVGFARVITDKATFAYLADVFILDDHRGKGLSVLLMNAILSHPDLQGLRKFLLATRDAHGLYEKFGFKPLGIPERWMEIHNKDVYQK